MRIVNSADARDRARTLTGIIIVSLLSAATSLDLSVLSLQPNTTYHWRVTALDIDGYTCPLGPWSFTTAP
mgnify:CR=1 FL=1